jgi:modulator of FtsH protease HflC
MMTTRCKFNLIAPWIFLLALVLIVQDSFYLVPQGSVAVLEFPLMRSQKPLLQSSPGLYGKWPFIQKVWVLEQRDQIVNASLKFAATATEPAIILDYTAKWRMSDPLRYVRQTDQTRSFQEQLTYTIQAQLKTALDRLSLQEKLKATEKPILQQTTLQTLNQSLTASGIHLLTLNFVGLRFAHVDPDNLFNTLRTQQIQKALQQRELGEEHAAKIRQQAEKEAAQLLESSRQKALALRYQGDEEAAKIYYDAYHRDRAFAAFFLKLKAYEAAFVANAKKENILILHLEDSALKKDQNTGTMK